MHGSTDTVESLVAQGYTRVQAIKLLYESSQRQRTNMGNLEDTAPNSTGSGPELSPPPPHRLMRKESKVLKEVQRLNRQSFAERSIMRTASEQERDFDDDGLDYEQDGMSTPSSLSEDTCFRELKPSTHLTIQAPAYDSLSRNPQPYPSADARQLDLVPMRKLHAHLFPEVGSPDPHLVRPLPVEAEVEEAPAVEEAPEVEEVEEEEEGIMQAGRRFLQAHNYSEDEQHEFLFLLEQGFGLEEAEDFIQQRRDNIAQQTAEAGAGAVTYAAAAVSPEFARRGSPSASASASSADPSSSLPPHPSFGPSGSGASVSKRSVKPLRADVLTGDRERDLELLLGHGYERDQALEICEQVYFARSLPAQSAHPALPERMSADSPATLPSGQTASTPAPKRLVQRIASMPDESFAEAAAAAKSLPPAPRPPVSILGSPARLPPGPGPVLVAPAAPASDGLDAHTLQLGLLLARQEARFGVNMYDTLLPTDESTIEDFVRQGHSLDDAVLLIFERRYGRIVMPLLPSLDEPSSRRSTPTLPSKSIGDMSSSSPRSIDLEAANQLEAEIALLVLAGYSRDEAVQILLRRRTAGRDDDCFSVAESSSLSKAAPATRSSNGPGARDLLRASFAKQPQPQPHSQPQVLQRRMSADFHAATVYEEPSALPPPPMRSTSFYQESSARGPALHAAPPAMHAGGFYPPGAGYGPYGGAYPPHPYRADEGLYEPEPFDRDALPLSQLSSDERALRVGLMVSEQESRFGTNMFESIGPADQSALDHLLAQGFAEDEAAQMLFEGKVRDGLFQPRAPPPVPKPKARATEHECPEMAEAIRQSEREHAGRPGAVRVTGPGPSASGHPGSGAATAGGGAYSLDLGDTRDLDPSAMDALTGMGFTLAQAAQALRMHGYDLHDAANYLLGNC